VCKKFAQKKYIKEEEKYNIGEKMKNIKVLEYYNNSTTSYNKAIRLSIKGNVPTVDVWIGSTDACQEYTFDTLEQAKEKFNWYLENYFN